MLIDCCNMPSSQRLLTLYSVEGKEMDSLGIIGSAPSFHAPKTVEVFRK